MAWVPLMALAFFVIALLWCVHDAARRQKG